VGKNDFRPTPDLYFAFPGQKFIEFDAKRLLIDLTQIPNAPLPLAKQRELNRGLG
jgi:hypothetical protein